MSMVVVAVALSFAGFRSLVVEETVAVFEIAPIMFDATAATIVNELLANGSSEAIVQLIVAPVVQLNVGPLLCVSETKDMPAGSESVSATLNA